MNEKMKRMARLGVVRFSAFAAVVALASLSRGATITSSADTYIASASSTTPQGTATQIVENISSGNANRRWAYVSFDLSSFSNPITSAELDLYNTIFPTAANGAAVIDVYGLSTNKITPANENTLTYSNDPNVDTSTTPNTLKIANTYGGAPLTTFTSAVKTAAGTDVAFNVSGSGNVLNYLNANLGGTATFVIYGQNRTDNAGFAWASKENTTAGAFAPTLTLSVPEPASLSVALTGSVLLLARRRPRA